MPRKQRQESEHAEPVARVGSKRFRGAGAPVTGLSRAPKRENGYRVEPEIRVIRPLNLRPLLPCPYGEE